MGQNYSAWQQIGYVTACSGTRQYQLHSALAFGEITGLNVAMAGSLWPDQIRNQDDPSTFPNRHFVDYPLIAPSLPDRGSPTPQDDILFGIGKSEAILRSPSAAAQDKAEKLSWLIHLVGDVSSAT
jgi:hypothetical protein